MCSQWLAVEGENDREMKYWTTDIFLWNRFGWKNEPEASTKVYEILRNYAGCEWFRDRKIKGISLTWVVRNPRCFTVELKMNFLFSSSFCSFFVCRCCHGLFLVSSSHSRPCVYVCVVDRDLFLCKVLNTTLPCFRHLYLLPVKEICIMHER